MRDLAVNLHQELKGISLVYNLTGPAGGCWRIGPAETPAVTIRMDTLDFSRLTSGRLTPDEVRDQSPVVIDGDVEIANRALDHTAVPY